ncbi:MAG: beta-N-acetylhexosaminidase [Phototrophicales bacterium]|nr:beta-N-acetylhexosaminidase [Phototrophicales bacterium]
MPQMMFSFNGYVVPDHMLEMVKQGEVVSFCIFKKNLTSPAQLRDIAESIHKAARAGGQLTPLIGIDQEGGQLMAVANGATELPGNMALGATQSTELAEKAGYLLGRELLAMGVNVNFAPTLDVNNNPHNPVIGIRSFGDNPQNVANLGAAIIRGMQAQGIIATAKHFPGHGDTDADSHLDTPIVRHDINRLKSVEMVPFQRVIGENVGAIMTAHIIYPALDDQNPATISAPILTDLLRNEMGYNGIILTDAMDMYAVSRLGALPSTTAALDAGADLVMLGHLESQAELHTTLKPRYSPASIARIQAAQRRVSPEILDFSLVGCAEHRAIAQEIADRSITVVRDTKHLLPLSADKSLGVVMVQPTNLTPADSSAFIKIKFAERISQRCPDATTHNLPFRADESALREALDAVAGLDTVVVGTITANNDTSQAEFVNALISRGQNVIVVALRTPYDLVAFPHIEAYLCTYGIREVSMEAVARVLFGEIEARGVLPCVIPSVPLGV